VLEKIKKCAYKSKEVKTTPASSAMIAVMVVMTPTFAITILAVAVFTIAVFTITILAIALFAFLFRSFFVHIYKSTPKSPTIQITPTFRKSLI